MSRLSTVILVDDDARSQKALSFGFEREKVKVHAASTGEDGLRQLGSAGVKTELVIASLEGAGACDLVKQIRSRTDGLSKIPVLLLGSKAQRKAAFTAGASDFLSKPTYVKDVINLGRVLCAGKNGAASIFSGDVGDFPGMFYLVRALSAAGRTGVITFVRGLRRGEVRFYQGEVTSAQAGTLHGVAAFHQLLLWTEGRFELRNEDVVRRQQIPLSPQELFEDASRFLHDFAEVAGDLLPAAIYEQDLRRVAECVDKIPKEVSPVLRLFDGTRSVADVVEDSPFRVVETIKIACRLVELGAVRKISAPRVRGGAHAALAIGEDWMVGGDNTPAPLQASAREIPISGVAPGEPMAAPPLREKQENKHERREHRRERKRNSKPQPVVAAPPPAPEPEPKPEPKPEPPAPAPPPSVVDQEWTIPTPLASPADLASFAPVVPSQALSGEIAVPKPEEIIAAAGSLPAESATQVEGVLSDAPRESLEHVLAAMVQASTVADGPKETPKEPPKEEPKKNGEHQATISIPDMIAAVAPVHVEPVTEVFTKVDPKDLIEPPPPVPPPPVVAPPPAVAPPVVAAAPASTSIPSSGDVARAVREEGLFDEVEEEFFSQEHRYTDAKAAPVESFEDLDEGFEQPEQPPPNFIQRLFGGKPKPAPQPAAKRPPTNRPPGGGGTSARTGKKKRR